MSTGAETARILIVDDSAENLTALEAMLARPDLEIVKATSGREALRALLREEFALIILDVNMPVMDGFEVAALVRARPRCESTPIIFLTAYVDDERLARGYGLGAVDYLLAPFVPQILRTKVNVFVDLFRKSAEVRRQAGALRRRTEQLHQLNQASLAINGATSGQGVAEAVAAEVRALIGGSEVRVQVALGPGRHFEAGGIDPPPAAGDGRASRTVPFVDGDGRVLGGIEVISAETLPPEETSALVHMSNVASLAIQNLLITEERASNRLRDEFLATVSHELRTPLNAILSWSALMRTKEANSALTARAIEVIERNARAQAQLIDDLLDMSRIITGQMRLELRRVDVGEVVLRATESIRPAAETRGLSLTVDGHPPGVAALADPERLQQVLWNLLTNAVKFTPAGGAVHVSVSRDGGAVEIAIRDTGAGIAPAFLPHVFDRFRQAESGSTRAHRGLGLGLAIVRSLIEQQGGSVRAESPGEGMGSTLSVRIPAAPAVMTGTVPPASTTAESSPWLGGLRVLVLDDEPDNREALQVFLTGNGAVVRTAESVQAAMSVLEEWLPDVVLSDIAMPEEDGYAFLGRLRAVEGRLHASIPAIALTAHTQPRDHARALAAGFHAHVPKPVDTALLVTTLAGFVPTAGTRSASD